MAALRAVVALTALASARAAAAVVALHDGSGTNGAFCGDCELLAQRVPPASAWGRRRVRVWAPAQRRSAPP